MRLKVFAALVLGLAALGAQAQADPPAETPAIDAKSADTAAAMLAYYPPAAREAGVEGVVVMSCARNYHGAQSDCTLVSESPTSQGFAAAARSLIDHAAQNPKLPDQLNKAAVQVTFQFKLEPPSITPDLLKIPHVVTGMRWVRQPDADDFERVFPRAALEHNQDGRAVLTCLVTDEGLLTNCGVVARPSALGFEEAALELAKRFKMGGGTTEDGEPAKVGGGHATIPIHFDAPR